MINCNSVHSTFMQFMKIHYGIIKPAAHEPTPSWQDSYIRKMTYNPVN